MAESRSPLLTPDEIRRRIQERSSYSTVTGLPKINDTIKPQVGNQSHVISFGPSRKIKDNPEFFEDAINMLDLLDGNPATLKAALARVPIRQSTFTPRPYQDVGIKWLRTQMKAGLWDEPGLGKSMQAAIASIKPVGVTAPLYLCDQWAEVWAQLFPNDKVVLATGSKLDKLERARLLMTPDADVVIWNHEMFRYERTCNQHPTCLKWQNQGKCDHPKLAKRTQTNGKRMLEYEYPLPPVVTLIVDEAHHFRGQSAMMSKGLAEYAQHTPLLFMLTATPIFKEADDLFMQLHIMYPQIFNDYWKFVDTWCLVQEEEGYKSKIIGTRRPAALTKMLSRFGLRRTYQETGRDLPKAIYNQPITVELTPTEQRKYDYLLNEFIELDIDLKADGVIGEGGTLAATSLGPQLEKANPIFDAGTWIDKLSTLTVTKSKLDTLVKRVEDVRYRPDKTPRGILVFTWLRVTAQAAATALGISEPITGAMAAEDRRELALQSDDIVVANMAALSEGIDLSHLHHVIYFENYYVPGLQFGQALPRVLRERVNNPLDSEPVIIDFIHCKNTIDEVKYESVMGREMNSREVMSRLVQLKQTNPKKGT